MKTKGNKIHTWDLIKKKCIEMILNVIIRTKDAEKLNFSKFLLPNEVKTSTPTH